MVNKRQKKKQPAKKDKGKGKEKQKNDSSIFIDDLARKRSTRNNSKPKAWENQTIRFSTKEQNNKGEGSGQ